MKNIIVQKFGGTSVGSTERIAHVAKIIEAATKNSKVIVVVSAMSGETDRLIELSKSFSSTPNKREFDALISTGEKVSASLLAMALESEGISAKSYSASQVSLRTTSQFSKAKILDIDKQRMQKILEEDNVPIITGFQGITEGGDVTTLGRGGSDTTAVAIAAAVDAKRCDIYTDVDGIYTTDPNVVPSAKKLEQISMEGMLELSGQGAKVIQIRAVEFANKYRVPVRVLSSFSEGTGTMINLDDNNMEDAEISGIAFQKNQTKVTFTAVEDTPGIASKILGPLSDADIQVDVIVQNVGIEGKTDFTFTIDSDEKSLLDRVVPIIQESINYKDILIDNKIAKVSIVGVGIRSHAGVASKAFRALAEHNINIGMISTSEIKMTIVIAKNDLEKAVRVLHDEFELEK
ncbi:MAG: aspartate kinase [Pseudomonadota bacterium]|nr:aspartate kinase [Pseudomonadota bacterium]MEC8000250.1 aspartate kinase [Pseudomonadota bacterium]